MKQQLRMLSLAAILGCAVYVIAQATSPAGPRKVVEVQGDGGGQIARQVENAPERNGVQDVLMRYMCAKQQMLIGAAKDEGRENATSTIIEANCYSILTILRPDQQQHEIKVWEIDRYAQDKGRWHEIAKAPSMVKELLKIDAATDKRARAILDGADEARWGGWRKQMRQLANDPEFMARPLEERQRETERITKAATAGKSPAELIQEATAQLAEAVKQTRSILNAAQQKEMDTILAGFEKRILAGYNGKSSL